MEPRGTASLTVAMVKSARLTAGALAWNSCCFVPSTMYYDYLNFEREIRNFNAFLSPVHCRGDYWRTTSMHVRYKLSDVTTGSSEGKKCQTTSGKSWKTYWITYDIFFKCVSNTRIVGSRSFHKYSNLTHTRLVWYKVSETSKLTLQFLDIKLYS